MLKALKEELLMIPIDRARKIIQCYGGRASTWPDKESKDVQQLILESKSLSDLQQDALALDSFMGFTEQKEPNWESTKRCANRILINLPEQQQIKQSFIKKQLKDMYQLGKSYIESRQPFLIFSTVALLIMLLIGGFSVTNKENNIMPLADFLALYVDDDTEQNDKTINDLDVLAFLEPQVLGE